MNAAPIQVTSMNVLLMNVQRFAASLAVAGRFSLRLASREGGLSLLLLFLLVVAGGSSFSLPGYAQHIPPTAPCVFGEDTTPAGWFKAAGSPDCSNLEKWGWGNRWIDGPLPALPTGDETFSTMWAKADHAEAIYTNITGLVVGRSYKIPFYGLMRGAQRVNHNEACEGLRLRIDQKTPQKFPMPSTTWTQSVLEFTATATKQRLTVSAYKKTGASSSESCVAHFAIGAYPLEVIKTASVGQALAGKDVTFSFSVKNTGADPMTNVRIKEDFLERSDGTALSLTTGPTFVSNSGSSPEGSLQPGETATFKATYRLTQADVNVGKLSNQAVGAGTLPGGQEITIYSQAKADGDQAPTVINLPRTSAIDLVKKGAYQDTNANQLLDVGDRIIYSFEVENTGNVTLTDVKVTDPLGTVNGGPLATLAPGVKDTTTFSLAYDLTQADINKGEVINAAKVEAKDPDSKTISDTASLTTGLGSKHSIKLEKRGVHVDANNNSVVDLGDHIQYSFTVTNSGDVELKDISLTDNKASSVTGGPIATLAPRVSDSTTFTARYDLKQSDIDNGDVKNTATVTAKAPDDTPVTDSASVTTHEEGTSKIVLEKAGVYVDANGNQKTDVGDRIKYSFKVKNAGSLTLSDISITDPSVSVSGGTLSQLIVGDEDSTTFSAFHTLTQADLDRGEVVNKATASAKDPHGHATSDTSEVTVSIDTKEAVSLDKTGKWVDTNNNKVADLGDRIEYTFAVKNTGEVTLKDISVSDPLINGSLAVSGTLAPGDSNTTPLTANYDLTQADLDRGSVVNTATVKAKAPDDGDVDDTGSTSVSLPEAASIKIEKTVTFQDQGTIGVMEPGDRLNYRFKVTNNGNVSLSGIKLSDPGAVLSGTTVPDLTPGASNDTAVTGYHVLTQADVDNGAYSNTASVEGTSPSGKKAEALSTASFSITAAPAMKLEKTGVYQDTNGNGVADPDDHIKFAFKVTNTGNVTLAAVKITDPALSLSATTVPDLTPGNSDSTVSALYRLTQADIDKGRVDNKATATVPVGQEETVTSEASATVEIAQSASIKLTKTLVRTEDRNENGVTDVDDALIYKFSVENTGNVTLSNVRVTDPTAQVSGEPLATLAPGDVDEGTFTAAYLVKQADLDKGKVLNEAQVAALDPSSQQVTGSSSLEVPLTAAPKARLIKRAVHVDSNGNGRVDAEDHVEYRFKVENIGNVTLSDLRVEDEKVEVAGGPLSSLNVGDADETTFSADYEITQADVDAGEVRNTATLHAKAPDGTALEVVSETDEGAGDTVLVIEHKPAVELVLTGTLVDGDENGYPDAGEIVQYELAVTNAGNTTLSGVSIPSVTLTLPDGREVQVPVSGGPLDGFLPGGTNTDAFTASYRLTQDDIDQGLLNAAATVTGSDPSGEEVSASSQHELPLPQLASLALTKTGEYRGAGGVQAHPGETIHYEFEVENDGNVTVDNVAPSDPGPLFGGAPASGSLSAFAPASATLAPGDKARFTADYVLTATDIRNARSHEAGAVNTAVAQGATPHGRNVVSPEAEASVPMPGVFIGKSTPLSQVRRGDRVPYQLRVAAYALKTAVEVNVIDLLPQGFTYQTGSASVSYGRLAPRLEGRRLIFENVELQPDEPLLIDLSLLATASVKPGEYVNQAWVEDPSGEALTGVATATVEVIVEPVFDCSDITGLVFNDRNRNGYPDAGEEGIAGARVATAKGLLVTAGPKGKFHVACADLPDQRIGTNYIMKLDQRSLPSGYRVTTENPRVVRLTAGKVTNILFGTTIGRVVRLDVSDAAFAPDGVELQDAWQGQIKQLVTLLDAEPSVLRLVYQSSNAGGRLAARRMRALRRHIAGEWQKVGGRYRLEVETRMIGDTR
ncbi:DUF7507 domain-containing protein [Nitratireductor sp. PBL-C9]|uniref:DUF7507 domain-containing protein n=1 Tax=Nitratireductor sp. PBL-C9 TaxID=3435013 RepID=UPI003D7E7494